MNDPHAGRRAVIYTRIASHTVAERADSHAAQEARCLEHAHKKGYMVVETYTDHASGNSVERPGMNAMLAFLREHRADPHVVIIDDVSRLARNVEAHLKLLTAIKAAGGLLERCEEACQARSRQEQEL